MRVRPHIQWAWNRGYVVHSLDPRPIKIRPGVYCMGGISSAHAPRNWGIPFSFSIYGEAAWLASCGITLSRSIAAVGKRVITLESLWSAQPTNLA